MLRLGLPVTGGAAAMRPFSPLDLLPVLFADPSDPATLFTDRAGTIAVAAPGEPVGLVLDKSGHGHHLVAPADAARPVYQAAGGYHWLEFDGSSSLLETAAALPFSGTVFAAVAFRPLSYPNAFPHVISNRGAASSAAQQRHPLIFTPQSTPARIVASFGGAQNDVTDGTSFAGRDVIASLHHDGSEQQLNVNGAVAGLTSPALEDGSTEPYRVGGPNLANMRFYGSVQANAIPAPAQVAHLRRYFAARCQGAA